MRKGLLYLLSACMLTAAFPSCAIAGSEHIKIIVDGTEIAQKHTPVVINGRTLVAADSVFGALGTTVLWDEKTKGIDVYHESHKLTLTADSTEAVKDKETITLDTAPRLIDDVMMVPLRFIAESIGTAVSWDEKTETVSLSTGTSGKTASSTSGIPNVLSDPKQHRPVPTDFEKSSNPEDLIYYPMKDEPEAAFNALKGGNILFTENALFDGKSTTQGMPDYGTYELVDVENMPFNRAIHFNVTKVPEKSWMLNFRIYPQMDDKYEDDDIMLIRLYARRISGGDFDTRTSKMSISYGECSHKKSLNSGGCSVTAQIGDNWTVIYLPVCTNHKYGEAGNFIGFNPGEYVQELEIGGFEMINYGKAYTIDDMPDSYGRYEGCEENAQWRKDALAKIERIRKGDINVIVKDKDGNAVPDADVKLDMYEHEFLFSVAVNPLTAMKEEAYRKTIVENFNSLGTEGGFHRKYKNQDKQKGYDDIARLIKWAYANGCAGNIKGHALTWDSETSEEPGLEVYDDATMGPYLHLLYDKAGLDAEIKSHFEWMAKKFPDVTDWDVSNEDGSRRTTPSLNIFHNVYGDEFLVNWYKYAREIFPNANLCLTDGFNCSQEIFKLSQKPFLDWAVKNLDFDTIGQQGHVGYTATPKTISDTLDILGSYGKRIRITEFDTGNITEDLNYQANLVRDSLIAYFANENVDMIQLWGFVDFSPDKHSKRILCNYDYSLKPAGIEYRDLVYNKWWTRENGTTDNKGTFSSRGYYGDYTITVKKDGKEIKLDVPCRKGSDNTITITI